MYNACIYCLFYIFYIFYLYFIKRFCNAFRFCKILRILFIICLYISRLLQCLTLFFKAIPSRLQFLRKHVQKIINTFHHFCLYLMLETVYGFSTRFHNNYMYKDKNNLYLERIIIRANFFSIWQHSRPQTQRKIMLMSRILIFISINLYQVKVWMQTGDYLFIIRYKVIF